MSPFNYLCPSHDLEILNSRLSEIHLSVRFMKLLSIELMVTADSDRFVRGREALSTHCSGNPQMTHLSQWI